MGKSSPSAPPAPNPSAQIAAQSAANREAVQESARVNAIDIHNPYGSTTYTRNDEDLPTAQTTTLTPVGQEAFDAQQRATRDLSQIAESRIGQIPTNEFNTNGLPYDPTQYNDPLTNRWQGINAPYDPSGSNYQSDSDLMRQSSAAAYGIGADAYGRAGDIYNNAGQTDFYQGQFGANNAAFRGATDNLNFDPRSYGDLDRYRGDVESSFFNRQASLLEPGHQQQREALEQQLADRGIPIGSEAYNDQINNLSRQQGDQLQRIANDAVLAGGAEAQRQLGMEQGLNTSAFNQATQRAAYDNTTTQGALGAQQQGYSQRLGANQSAFNLGSAANQNLTQDVLSRTGFEQGLRGTARTEALQDHQQINSDQLQRVQAEQGLRNTALQERLLNRNQAFNEASALITGAPALGVPQAPTTPNYSIAPPDVLGANQAAYNAQVNQYNAAQQRQANLVNSGFGVAGAALGKCAEEYKTQVTNVESALEKMRKLQVFEWTYKPEVAAPFDIDRRHVSPMAGHWTHVTGLGDKRHIHFGDYVGMVHAAMKELANEVDQLRTQIKEIRQNG